MSETWVPEGLLHIGQATIRIYNVRIQAQSGPNNPGSASFEVVGDGALPVGGPQILEVTGPSPLPRRRYSIAIFETRNVAGPRTAVTATDLTLIP
jgi:hypothetical protein